MFFTREDAEDYAGFYYKASENPLERTRIKAYTELKYKEIGAEYSKHRIINCVWILLQLMLLEDHRIKDKFMPCIFQALSHGSAKLAAFQKTNRSLRFLITAFQHHNLLPYKVFSSLN